MSEIVLQIDGKEVKATEGMTILEAARSAGISIPTLCHHEKLKPYGGCRLCIVEAQRRGSTTLVASCVSPVEENLVVSTRSEKIDRIRKTLLELLLAHAPHSEELQRMAQEYGADRDRFEKEGSFCIHCGLCVRYCAEVKKADAVGFIERGTRKEISFIPEIASKECNDCKECFPLCPTSYLQAAFVLTHSLAFPSSSCGIDNTEREGKNTRRQSGCFDYQECEAMTTNPDFLSPCGLYCGVCAVYIAHRDKNRKFKERLVSLYRGEVPGKGTLPNSERLAVEDIRCNGCLSDERFMHCTQCEIRECAGKKGLDGCHRCDEFPCPYIDNFPMAVGKKVILRAVPYRRGAGTEKWVRDEEARYVCPECGHKVFRGVVTCNRCKAKLDLD